MSNGKSNYFVSVVTVVENDSCILGDYIRNLQSYLDHNYTDYEIVLIDQNSRDNTYLVVDDLLREVPSVRFIGLSSRVNVDVACAAGMENAIGDFVVLHSLTQDPVNVIKDLVKLCSSGSDVVVGVSNVKKTIGYKLLRPWIQWVLSFIGYDIPKDATGLRCLSRRAIYTVTHTGRFHHQLYVRIAKSGYKTASYRYMANQQATEKKTLYKGFRQAVRLLIFNSTRPLRWMSGLGLLGSLMAFSIASYSIVVRFFKDNVIEGWTSTIMFLSLLFMLLFVILAFFGEYLGRLLDDRSEHQDYSVVDEKHSSVMLVEQRHNVLEE